MELSGKVQQEDKRDKKIIVAYDKIFEVMSHINIVRKENRGRKLMALEMARDGSRCPEMLMMS